MSSIQKVITEINASSSLVAKQKSMNIPGVDPNMMINSVCSSVCTLIRTCPHIGASECSEIVDAAGHSHFDEDHKATIIKAAYARMGASVSETNTTSSNMDKQAFATPKACLNYFTQDDWDVFQDPSTEFDDFNTVSIVVKRLMRGGFTNPSPKACADLVTIVASAKWPDGDNAHDNLYKHTFTIAKAFRDAATASPPLAFAKLKVFPDRPDTLPQHVFLAMYESTDGPAPATVDNWGSLRAQVSCRNTNKNVRANHPTNSQVANQNHCSIMDQSSFNSSAMQMLMNTFMQAMGKGGGKQGVPVITFQGRSQKQLESSSSHSETRASSPHGQTGAGFEPASQQPALGDVLHDPGHSASVKAALNEFRPQASIAHAPAAAAASSGQGDVSAVMSVAEIEREHMDVIARKRDKLEKATEKMEKAKAAAKPGDNKRKATPIHIGQQPPAYNKNLSGGLLWLGAKLLPSESKNCYRLWLNPSIPAQEKSFKYGDNAKDAWTQACKYIKDNNGSKGEAKKKKSN